jgi:GNAT superfamily N-acetyltransferase
MANSTVEPITALKRAALEPLLDASLSEGYDFIQTLWDEYESGKNRFDTSGAGLYGISADGALIAVGGVHTDPYLGRADIGRIRHVYVMPADRRGGIGKALMAALVDHARASYAYLTLRTLTAHGDAFYSAIGFSREPRFEHATHWMQLAPEET